MEALIVPLVCGLRMISVPGARLAGVCSIKNKSCGAAMPGTCVKKCKMGRLFCVPTTVPLIMPACSPDNNIGMDEGKTGLGVLVPGWALIDTSLNDKA